MAPFHLGLKHLILVAAACLFATLLWITGWTWPLEGVAVLLPVATMMSLG